MYTLFYVCVVCVCVHAKNLFEADLIIIRTFQTYSCSRLNIIKYPNDIQFEILANTIVHNK
jgi:hypothetical protein